MGSPDVVTRRGRAPWVLAHVAATFLSFPHPVADGVLDLGAVASWFVPLTLLVVVRGLSPGRAFGWALLAAGLGQGALLHFIYVVTVHYGNAPAPVGFLASLGLGSFGASLMAVWAAFAAWAMGRSLDGIHGDARPWLLAAAFAVTEHARSWLFTGMPWGTLGYAHHDGPLLAIAPITGVVGLSFVTALGGLAAVSLLAPPWARRLGIGTRRAGAAALVVLALAAGGARWAWAPAPDADALRVAIVQGNIEQGVKWSPEWAERTLAIYFELSRRAAAEGAELIAWPETAVPGSPDGSAALRARLRDLAEETGATLIVGAVGLDDLEAEWPRLYDSAFVFAPGHPVQRYDKAHLVPFGEYLPFRPLLGRFIRAIATGSAGRDVTEGPGPAVLEVPVGDRLIPVGTPICYELLFPDLMRGFAGQGARVLVALTNDAWYGATGAPYQFLAMTELRAAESGLWIARAANTGVSARIDGRGRVREQTAIFETATLTGAVPLRSPEAGATFYVRHGDWFPRVCGLVVLALGLALARTPKPASPPPPE